MALSVLTLNLWHDSGPWPERRRRIREWIERLDPDLIGFQEALSLPDSGDGETRSAIGVTVEAPLGPVAFTSTHLHWKFHHGRVRERQLVALCEVCDDEVGGLWPSDHFGVYAELRTEPIPDLAEADPGSP